MVIGQVASVPMRIFRGLAVAVRARPILFAGIGIAVLLVNIVLPPLVLSIARKPCDYFTVNPWLPSLPGFLTASAPPFPDKLAKLWRLALFWFSSSNPYGVEWGFAVDTGDLVRMVVTSLLIAAYFALWRERQAARRPAWSVAGRRAGFAGAFAGVLGLSSGPCGVMGCGAPVIPVVGLAFAGLSSTALNVLKDFSTWTTSVVLIGMTLGVAYLAWLNGSVRADSDRSG